MTKSILSKYDPKGFYSLQPYQISSFKPLPMFWFHGLLSYWNNPQMGQSIYVIAVVGYVPVPKGHQWVSSPMYAGTIPDNKVYGADMGPPAPIGPR